MNPTLLIASPQMKDPFFERTLVLVWQHDEDGALGVVVNRALDSDLQDVVKLEGVEPAAYGAGQLAWGGPVEEASGTVVTPGPVDDVEGWVLPSGLGVTRSQEALERLLKDEVPLMLCLGYAGWGPGQLDQEIQDGGWIALDCDADLLFETPSDERYNAALARLGLTPHTVWMQPIDE